jgi:acetyl esterase/lipase
MPSTIGFDPDRNHDVRVWDVEYLQTPGETWEARIYQPQGTGPFPALLYVHGGAWNSGSRMNDELFNMGLAADGLVVVAVDFRLAPDHKYPAQVVDVNYATRWVKAHASEFDARPDAVGGSGSSSGGHTIMVSAMRPDDPRYGTHSSPELAGHDARLDYVLLTWPVLDSHARYQYARSSGLDRLVSMTESYFPDQDAMREGNPQGILDRGCASALPPALIIQGTADANVPMSIPESFVASYRSAGGEIELELFPGMLHGFGGKAGPETDRALGLMKAFVARQLAAPTTSA